MSGDTERSLSAEERAQWDRINSTLGVRAAVDLWRWDTEPPRGIEPDRVRPPYDVEREGGL